MAHATLTARNPTVVCAIEEATRLFELCGASARASVASSVTAESGMMLLEVEGRAGAIHRDYKMAQTLMED